MKRARPIWPSFWSNQRIADATFKHSLVAQAIEGGSPRRGDAGSTAVVIEQRETPSVLA